MTRLPENVPPAPSPPPIIRLELFLLSAATLAFENTLTRLFSVAQFYHFAFMIVSIPVVWQGVDYEKPEGEKKTGKQAASIAMGAVGILSLTIQFLMAPTHTIGGINYANVWHTTLTLLGMVLILGGVATAVYTKVAVARRQELEVM